MTLTRRGRPVAVVVAEQEYQRLRAARPGFWDAVSAFRQSVEISDLAVEEAYRDVRDRSPGRDIPA